jgi:hypothetical protein
MSWDVQVNAAGAPPPVVAEMPGDWQGSHSVQRQR